MLVAFPLGREKDTRGIGCSPIALISCESMRVLNCVLPSSKFFFDASVLTPRCLLLCTIPFLLSLSYSLSLAGLILRRSCARGDSSRRGDTGGLYFEHGGDKEGREEGERPKHSLAFGVLPGGSTQGLSELRSTPTCRMDCGSLGSALPSREVA